ncbi:MAG TPA: peptidoglycan DD-metalloendopeptidase family protein [Thermoanaerobaculia bacterium]|nr:peptidoglycan DD-metalloendopeptidase family protein [Thermoanaerobaculia bacterium]
MVLSGTLLAQTPSPDEQRQADLARIRARIASLQSKLAQSKKTVATLSEEIRRLDWKLELGEEEGKLLAARREELARELAATKVEEAEAAQASTRLARDLVSRARLLHRFGRYGYFRVLLEANDLPAFLLGVERLDALARRDGKALAAYREARQSLEEDRAREEALKTETDRVYAKSRREIFNMERLRRERSTLLEAERSASASERGEVVALSDKAERLERLLETLSQQSSGEVVDPSGGIRPWKGVLDWPARGTLTETFGRHRHPRFDVWTISNGIVLALPPGTPVLAVYGGKAVYAQWLAEYGNLVILDHGDGVFTLYAWLQSVSVAPGSYVPVGSRIGRAGTGPGREEPGLYFEVRDRQKASDPVAWLR